MTQTVDLRIVFDLSQGIFQALCYRSQIGSQRPDLPKNKFGRRWQINHKG
jgi:hypothetical protein